MKGFASSTFICIPCESSPVPTLHLCQRFSLLVCHFQRLSQLHSLPWLGEDRGVLQIVPGLHSLSRGVYQRCTKSAAFLPSFFTGVKDISNIFCVFSWAILYPSLGFLGMMLSNGHTGQPHTCCLSKCKEYFLSPSCTAVEGAVWFSYLSLSFWHIHLLRQPDGISLLRHLQYWCLTPKNECNRLLGVLDELCWACKLSECKKLVWSRSHTW